MICIWHKGCLDGFTSAFIVSQVSGDENPKHYHEGVYNEPPPDVTGQDVIMVDFSYPEKVIEEMAAKARSMLILDHHKTAEAALRRWQVQDKTRWGGKPPEGECWAWFDMNRSGAGMTWDYFSELVRPRMVDHVEDRDLWRFKIDGSREIAAVMFSHEMNFANWHALALACARDETYAAMIFEGRAIMRSEARQRDALMHETLRPMKIGGILMPVCNAPYMWSSEMGNTMSSAPSNPAGVAATYYDRKDGKRQFSLRSDESGPDVSKIAQTYGGGGHFHAAGFTAPYAGWEGDAT